MGDSILRSQWPPAAPLVFGSHLPDSRHIVETLPSQTRSGRRSEAVSYLTPHGVVFSNSTSKQNAMGATALEGPAESVKRDPVPPLTGRAQISGLAPERDSLLALGFPEPVVRAPSTRASYPYRWGLTKWIPTQLQP